MQYNSMYILQDYCTALILDGDRIYSSLAKFVMIKVGFVWEEK